jgi:hypothetical protein
MNAAETERTKLTANFLNAIASGTVVASLVGPFVTIGMGLSQPTSTLLNLVGLSLLGLTVAIVLHLAARRVLLGLED